jgi:hypothetical protein
MIAPPCRSRALLRRKGGRSQALFGELEDRHPTIVIMLLATLSIELSNRLRETTGLVRRMDDARG